jgi:hypothetical protein
MFVASSYQSQFLIGLFDSVQVGCLVDAEDLVETLLFVLVWFSALHFNKVFNI